MLLCSRVPSEPGSSANITIVNLTDSKDPKTVRQFADVTSVLPDRARGLIYLTNPQGASGAPRLLRGRSQSAGNAI